MPEFDIWAFLFFINISDNEGEIYVAAGSCRNLLWATGIIPDHN